MSFAQIGTVVVDVFITENHGLPSETTSYPREKGPNVSDHTRPMPLTLSVEGFISDAPIGKDLIDLRDRETAGQKLPSEFAYAKLEEIYKTAEPVTVVTSLRTYESMVMLSCEITRDKDNGKALQFSCSFQQLTTVTNQRTVIRAETRGVSKVARGFKGSAPVKLQFIDGTVKRVYFENGQYVYADKTKAQYSPGATTVNLDKNSYTTKFLSGVPR